MPVFAGIGLPIIVLTLAVAASWRLLSRRWELPCSAVFVRMLERPAARIRKAGLTNITLRRPALGEGELQDGSFDRAVMVTVLGEIPNQAAALREIIEALKPGGVLSITEVLPDPRYQG